MGPTEDQKHDDAAMPGMGMPADSGAMPPAPAAGVDPTAIGGTAEPNPEEVSMSDEAPSAMPPAPATPAMPPQPPAPAVGAEQPGDPGDSMPGAAPQQ